MKKFKILAISFFLLILISKSFASDQTASLTDKDYKWVQYNGHSYALTNSVGSWESAEAEAKSVGGHLVTINTKEENNWIVQEFGNTTYWIGLYQTSGSSEPAGGFVWVSRESVAYTKWLSGEPNNFKGSEGWVVINYDKAGFWNDEPLNGYNSSHKGIIELK